MVIEVEAERRLGTHGFIAIPKASRAETLGVERLPWEVRKQFVVGDSFRSASVGDERLASLGLALAHGRGEPSARGLFNHLPFLSAYIVNTDDQSLAAEASGRLESDHHILPDIELALPGAFRQQENFTTQPPNAQWPTNSGINEAHNQGITGTDVIVGVLDTGCDPGHDALKHKNIPFCYVPPNPDIHPLQEKRGFDPDVHGTHVCGIISADGFGVAPSCDLLVASVIENDTLLTSLKRIMYGLDWLLAQSVSGANQNKPMIINMSFGLRREWIGQIAEQSVFDGIRSLLSQMSTDFGVLPIAAIGNDGPGTLRAPAYFTEALAVGSVGFDLTPSGFSGSGPSPDGMMQPDIFGYGEEIVSCAQRDAAGTSWYCTLSGTSMATPYVAGIAALIASADANTQRGDLRNHLLQTALQLDLGGGNARSGTS